MHFPHETNGTPSLRAVYEYNGLNWRTVKGGAPLGTLNRKRYGYYSANWQLLQEDIDDPLDQGQTIDKRIQYLWGLRYIDDIILHREDSNVNGTYDKTWYHLTDAQFSTVAIVDENAHLAERVTYSAYGEARHHWAADVNGDGAVTNDDDRDIIEDLWQRNSGAGTRIDEPEYLAEADLNRDGVINEDDYDLSATLKAALGAGTLSSSDVQNIVGYAGYLFNGDIRGVDQYHVRHRVYDPGLGRWITRDPLGFVDGMNLYEYVGGRPVGTVDPTGLILAAVDGTKMGSYLSKVEKTRTRRWRSHVRNFSEDYGSGPASYWAGPENAAFYVASEMNTLRSAVVRFVCQHWCRDRSQPIDMVGFSRGGYAVMEAARLLDTVGCCCDKTEYKPVPVRFMGLYDPVDMAAGFGDGDGIPRNVQSAFVIRATGSHSANLSRDYFRRVGGFADSPATAYTMLRVVATHGAIGGAPWSGDHPAGHTEANDNLMAVYSDRNMRQAARAAGVAIPPIFQYGYQ